MNRHNAPFDRTPLRSDRVRRIDGSFAFIPHRFRSDGFWASLQHHELLLYLLLVLVADRQGMSFYYDDRLASMLRFILDDFLAARQGLLRKDLIAYDPVGPRYQVLSLPPRPVLPTVHQVAGHSRTATCGPRHISEMIQDFLATCRDDSRNR